MTRVFAGETVRFEEMPLVMTRHGYPEETWWNFSYSPVRAEHGEVAGLLNVTVDASPKIRADRAEAALRQSEERQAFLLELSDALRPLASANEIRATTTQLLGRHLGVDRAMYVEVESEPGAEAGTVHGQYVRPAREGEPAAAPFPQHFFYDQFGVHTMAARYRSDLLIVSDVDRDPPPCERATAILYGRSSAFPRVHGAGAPVRSLWPRRQRSAPGRRWSVRAQRRRCARARPVFRLPSRSAPSACCSGIRKAGWWTPTTRSCG